MTLSRGRDILAIPGPSIIPDRVLAAMHRPAPNIYEGELVEMTETIVADLAPGGADGRQGRDLHRQRPCRLGGGDRQHPRARAEGARHRHRPLRPRLGADGADDGRRRRGDGLRLPGRHRPRARRRSGSAPTAGTRSARCWRCRPTPPPRSGTTSRRCAAALDAAGHPGAPRHRLHRLPRLRPLRDGRLGRRRDGGRLPEGADDPAGHGLHLPRAARPRRPASAAAQPLLGLAARARRRACPTSASAARRRPTTSTACGLRARHDPRRGGARGGLGPPRGLRPRGLGGGRGLGRGRRARAQHRRPGARAATRSPPSAPARATARGSAAGAPTPPG